MTDKEAGDVHHAPHQRLVQRDHGIGVTPDPGAVTQRLGDGLAQDDTGVLNRVMPIDVEIAPGLDREIEQAVPGQRREHVVEKPDSGLHVRVAPAVQVDPNSKIGLVGLAGDFGDSGHRLRVRGKR
jgi:hypothetical protein